MNRLRRIIQVSVVLQMLILTAVMDAQTLESRRQKLAELIAQQWEYTLTTNPELASLLGDKRFNDRLSDFSEEAVHKDLQQTQSFLMQFEAINTAGFPDQEKLNKELMIRSLKEKLDNARFKLWEMPVDQFSGIHVRLVQLVSQLQFQNTKDYDDYVARLKQVPRALEQNIILMRKGMADKLMPPKFLLEQAAAQADRLASLTPEESPFGQSLRSMPSSIPPAEQTRIRNDVLAAIRDSVLPSYVKFAKFVRDEYAPHGRTEPGVWSLPDGQARYAALAKQYTTTNLTPDEIHQLGLAQVAAIEAKMLAFATQQGYKDLKSFHSALQTNPKFHPHSREELLDLYRKYIDQMYPRLPELFIRLPKAKLEVLAVESFREQEAPAAQYLSGSPDGSRPGRVEVNTGDFEHRSTLPVEAVAYHEGVPGHHMQISISQELPTLPPFRQQATFSYSAYSEGWGLYAEALGKDVGFYKDPYSYYGYLQNEMLRAIRLVVDTGLHYKKWSRQQVVDFFHAHSAIDETDVQNETNRYIAIPGQALSYKVGQLKLIELREYAKSALGKDFDIREFHDQVLGAGALPLDILETRIKQWVTAEQMKQRSAVAN